MDTAEDTSLEEEISNVEELGAQSEPPQLDKPEEGGEQSRKRSFSDSDELEDLPEKRARTDEAEIDTTKDEDLPPVIDMTLHQPVTENTVVGELPVEDAGTSVSERLAENKETSVDAPAVDDAAPVEELLLLEKVSCEAKETDEDNKSKDDESCGSSLSSETNTEADEEKNTGTERVKDQNVKEETKQSESNSSSDFPNPVDQVASETVNLGQNKNEEEVNGLPTENGTDDSSTGKSDDSEKENINLDLPVNLSNDKKSGSAPDVIMLSDDSDEDSKMPNGIIEEMSEEELNRHKQIIKKLQAELRNEEAKLVLLKKLHQSQLTQQIQDHTVERPKPNPPRQSNGPPPLVRGGQQMTNSKMLFQNGSSHSVRGPPMMPSRSQTHGPPPLIMAPRVNNSHSHLMSHGMRGMMHGATNPNLMPGFRPVQPPQQAQIQQRQEEVQTPAQRQAAAKLALRKQLEKTLLQIPPPKPPPPEMNFIPSLSCPDFIMLLGLEEVVNFIIDSQLIAKGEKNPDEKFVCNPFSCVQCNADYTPVWKREKPGSKNVICEHCVTSNQKKALKQEHTNRLKSAFVKALQQEQEIERMQAQSLAQQQQQAPPQQQSVQTTTVSTPMSLVTTSPMNLSTSYKPSPEQLRQHQNFIQAHQAQLRAGQPLGMQPFGHRGPFPYQIPFTKQSDLQRQYLLDLIPRGGSMSWKS